MSLALKYEGVDITSRVNISQCVHDMYCERHADTLLLKFSNSEGLWDKWKPKSGDTLEIEDNNVRSGKMFVKKIEPMTGFFVLKASSIPISADAEHSKSWEKVTKLQLAKDLAHKHGLLLKVYGVEDRKFSYLQQSKEKDFVFFENLCVLEGDAFLIYDGCLILYNEKYMETMSSNRTLKITGENEFHYEEEMEYSGCTIMNESKSFTYMKDNEYWYVAEKKVQIYIESDGDAERYSKNMLRYLNKEKRKGYFYTTPLAKDYAAGSVINIKTVDAGSYDGPVFITHIRHDYKNGKSKIFFRKPYMEE